MAFFLNRPRMALLSKKAQMYMSLLRNRSMTSSRAFSTGSFKYEDLVIEKTKSPKEKPAKDHNYVFGKVTTDHMLEIDWHETSGWGKPIISPYRPFSIDPANSTLHYALECFEGLKAYPAADNKTINLFRPIENMKRMKVSFDALAFPTFDADELLKLVMKLVEIDVDWMPWRDKHSLYIRPTGISMENSLGVRPASSVKLFWILSPVGPYYPKGFVPVSVNWYTDYIRAWYKGSGNKKIGSNYGPTIKPARTVSAKGYDQILWLIEDYVSEVGVMNAFVFWVNEQGEKELITCPLDGTILPGVTRDSILQLTRHWGEFKVTEKRFKIQEITKAVKENRMLEMFGCGTAAVVSPIKNVGFEGQDYPIPIDSKLSSGKLTYRLANEILDLQAGKKQFKDWVVKL